MPGADDLAEPQHRLLAIAQHRDVDEIGDRFGIAGAVPADHHDRVIDGSVRAAQRDTCQVEGVQQVGVAQFGRQADTEHIERAHRTMGLQACQRHFVLPHQGFHVGPDREDPLGADPAGLIEHLVEDCVALVGLAHLVGVRVHQHPVHIGISPRRGDGVELAAHILDGLGHVGQQGLDAAVDGRRFCGVRSHIAGNGNRPAG
ncbi:hypothetical protein SDC9_99352 [bioreactor metagenome]|uniref:Uncharacterized protein n=1 Tax=bioreactor metagenome TaxID=1076179 RepID=A0A645AHA6_9ZZZZ